MNIEYFPYLFEPFSLGTVTARNRIVHAPMSVSYADGDGFITQAVVEHYARRAQGGAGIVMTENFAVNVAGRQMPKQALIAEEKHLPGLHQLATEIKRHGALAIVQIVHAGRYAGPWGEYEKRRRLAPSALSFPLLPGRTVTPQEITIEEIEETIVAFGHAAHIAQQAGFDGIEIHGAQGFLISQFVSPWINHRTDEYGGDFERRIRFPLAVVREVRRRVGTDFLAGFHLMSDELQPGGWTLNDSLMFAQRLEQEGIDFLVPVVATFESLKLAQNQGLMWRPAFQLKETIAIKQVVRIPVIGNGKLNEPELANTLIKQGKIDAVGLSRALFTDPDWTLKVQKGNLETIRACPCNPPLCLQTQLSGAICNHWPEEVQQARYLGYNA